MAVTSFQKQPNDVLDYDVDMTEWFADIEGDDIQVVDVSIASDTETVPTLVAGPAPHPAVVLLGATPLRFKLWLGGGTNYTDYTVTCVVTTEADRVKEIEFKIKVRNT
ncbi:hypothetical protein VPH49_22010 [Pseudomonas luteola]|uniref:phage fiber-tail adaptor protein n=1 Tax=Pseudomonas luteola TaxID=47886 RepID=UPI003A86EDE7